MSKLRIALIVPALAALPAVVHADSPAADIDQLRSWDRWPAGAHVPRVKTIDLSAAARARARLHL